MEEIIKHLEELIYDYFDKNDNEYKNEFILYFLDKFDYSAKELYNINDLFQEQYAIYDFLAFIALINEYNLYHHRKLTQSEINAINLYKTLKDDYTSKELFDYYKNNIMI